jgi:thiol-disulfide isomerase/thioredoxin
MPKVKYMKIGIIIVVVIGALAALIVSSSNKEVINEPVVEMQDKMQDRGEQVNEEEEMDGAVENMDTEDDVAEVETGATASQQGTYTDYAPELVAEADGDIVLFFHASWCPSCRTQDASIVSGAAEIPADLTILKVDYDSSTELKREHGVTTQHTFVQVDSEGNQITKWIGGSTLGQLVAKVQ